MPFKFLPLALSILAASAELSGIAKARDLERLDILRDRYPRVFFFRATEQAFNARRYPTYESWASQFDRLQGIMGKCLDEECRGREPRNAEFFSRFKRENPSQVVLLHFNGNARDPRYRTEKYFPGHWIYGPATEITADVPAEAGPTVIHVQDARRFRVNTGRYQTSNDDIGLFGVTADGRHDWSHCEQVQLIAVDTEAHTITVRRGCYGTRPLAFRVSKSRAAAHVVEGPWGAGNNLMWFYNFSTHCPRDDEGKTCADRLTDDLASWFGPEGPLAAFDGLEFDVMFYQTRGDTDGDGVEDGGISGGINHYGIGVVEFARQLRQRMSDDFIIQGDGALGPGGVRSQRGWQILNGIESEGWPNLQDWEMQDWSGGLNRHFFWRDNARSPVFNYVNHKWTQNVPGKPGVHVNPDVPFARHRLVLAACQFFDAATCYSFAPADDPDGRFGIWDELRCGTDNRVGWLGRPEGPAARLAAQTPDLLAGGGTGPALAERISGPIKTTVTSSGVRITAGDGDRENLRFKLRDVPVSGPELYLSLTMRGEPRAGYPAEMARFAQVGVSGGFIDLMEDGPLATGMRLRGSSLEVPLDRSTGATFESGPRSIASQTRPTFFVHPPYRDSKGYTFWTTEEDVPANAELRFLVGMGVRSPERSDGVWFQVHVAEVRQGVVGKFTPVFETTTNRHVWLPQSVSLKEFGGKRLRFKFIADCGPHDNATTDHAHWGDVKLATAGAAGGRTTPLVQHMTWLNERPFESTFYFRHVRSQTVDVTFTIDGREDIVLHSLSAHSHPDAIYRVFEGGIVLANPSPQPYTFALAELSPGRNYRRLNGSVSQDPQTNSGSPVGGSVTLGERDALFLVRYFASTD